MPSCHLMGRALRLQDEGNLGPCFRWELAGPYESLLLLEAAGSTC